MCFLPGAVLTVAVIVTVVMILCAGPVSAAEPAATPQRPSVSFGTGTVPARLWELEGGGQVADGGSAIPLFLKYGLTNETEVEIGLDAVRQVEQGIGTRSSVGDLFVGVRSRFRANDD